MINLATPENVRAAREKAGLTAKQAAELFGYSLSGWQNKENARKNGRKLSWGEYQYLLLLADTHPSYTLIPRSNDEQ